MLGQCKEKRREEIILSLAREVKKKRVKPQLFFMLAEYIILEKMIIFVSQSTLCSTMLFCHKPND